MMRVALIALLAVNAAAFQESAPQTPTFKAGTRLVEVEVVVRNKNGPVTNLTRDDFTILDQGKPQRIDVFSAGQSSSNTRTVPLPPGAVSNRLSRTGEPVPNTTVVLFDVLNTRFDLKAYETKTLIPLVRGMGAHDRTAIYWLGKNLHVLQDFTDDPGKLLAAITHLDSGRDLMPANVADAMADLPTDSNGNPEVTGLQARFDPKGAAMAKGAIDNTAGLTAQVYGAMNNFTTTEALMRIVSHLEGMPGRRNLIWLKESPAVSPAVMLMFQQADIHLYPVMVRTVLTGSDIMAVRHAAHQLGEAAGGEGFDDATNVGLAVKRAEEDSRSAYTLGYYPPEELLDGKYHRLTVRVEGKAHAHLEVLYRAGYIATRQPVVIVPPRNTVAEIFQNPLDDTAIGITAKCEPDSTSGFYKVRLAVDLRNVHMVHEGGHSKGSIQLGFLTGKTAQVRTMAIDLTDAQLADVLRDGYGLRASGVPATGNMIRVMARDPSTGVVGTLTIRVPAADRAHSQ